LSVSSGSSFQSRFRKQARIISSVSIIGVGTMARIVAAGALAGGNAVEVIGRDPGKAATLPVCSAAAGP
jgi:hypothetical protein